MRSRTTVGKGTLASAYTLTDTYATQGGVITCTRWDQFVVTVDYTKGDETTMEMRVQLSDTKDFTDAFERPILDTAATGASTVAAEYFVFNATNKFAIQIRLYMPYVRVQFKATGGTPTGTVNARYRIDNIER